VKRHLFAVVVWALASTACDMSCRDVSVGAGVERRPPASLSIAAASDLRYAFEEITAAFKAANPQLVLSVSYGSSGNFYAQLVNGAPFDLFLSADVEYPRRLAAQAVARPESLFSYANGRLAIWVGGSSPIDVERLGMKSLTASAVTHVAIANPQHAPYGRAAEAAMQAAGILEQVKPKLVLGENISQTMQFVQSGAADIGIVALSLARAPQTAGSGRYWVVPAEAHPPIEQGGAMMRATKNAAAAQEFRTFLLGTEARAILQRYGFDAPAPTPDK
jgi:molybdate transport system substrate-binding protein